MVGAVASSAQSQAVQTTARDDPRTVATAILAETSGRPATYDRLGQIEARLDDLARTDPEFAAQVRAEILASPDLTPVQKGQLTANAPGRTVDLDGSQTQRFAPGGMAWDPWIDSQRARNTPEFQVLAQLAGSTENGPIKEVMQQLHDRGITAAQLQAEQAAQGPDGGQLTLDLIQMGLDLTGIVDPSPVSDGSNAVISLGRGISSLFSGEWGEAGGHVVNGLISAVGIVPGLGDLAKAGKIGKWAQTVSDAIGAVARNPELARTIEPALREIHDLVQRIPQGALDALPQSAREALERMKTQLDEFFGAGARAADAIPVQRFTNAADFNRAANNAAPNTRYEYAGYSYTTDANGRVATAEGTISLAPAGRNDPDLQRRIGDEGRPTDVGFHLIGDRFGGQTNRLNVVPGNGAPIGDGQPNLNQGAFKRFENEVARIAGQPGNTVEVRISAEYDPGNLSTRPDSFVAEYRVNGGAWRTRAFDNK